MSVAPTAELSPLKRAFLALEQADARLKAAEAAAREPIAVIGLGCQAARSGRSRSILAAAP